MLTPTYVNIRSSSYPIGTTPAANLLRDLRPGKQPVEILALGCGDVRNILFTLWSQQHNTCKINFTTCDSDPAVLARNIFLLTAITQDASSEELERLWRAYYHFYVTSADLLFVQKHCNKLLAASNSISSWKSSPFGSSLEFSTEACLLEVRRIWSLYAQIRTKQEEVAIRHAIRSMYDKHLTTESGPAIMVHGVRSAGAHGVLATSAFNETFHSYWNTGVVAGNDQDVATLGHDGGRVNPLMAVSSFGSFNVHYGTEPLLGFHLAEVFDIDQTTDAARKSLAHLAKSQFSAWCHEYASFVASGSVNIMHHCGDAVNLSHALQAIEGSATLPPFTHFYTKPWSSVPLELPSEMVTRYDVVDTSNVMDHVGLLNLLLAVVPLLSARRDSVLYTESLLQGAEESEDLLETLLHSNVTTSSLLFGVVPVGHILGTMTDSTHVERLIDVSARSVKGRHRQYHMRIPWKYAAQGDSLVLNIESAPYRLGMDPHELASFFMQSYLSLFQSENISTQMRDMKRRLTHPLAGDLGFYSRLSLVTLVASAQRNISTDWRKCINALVELIEDDRSLIVGSNSLQELYMYLHLSGLWHSPVLDSNPRQFSTYYGVPRPPGEPGVLGQSSLPGTVHVALVVPGGSLTIFTGRDTEQVGTPGMHLNVVGRGFDNSFHAIDVFFGRFESDAIDSAKVVEDVSGWSGTSDMIVTSRIPTWGLLLGRRQDLRVELNLNTSPATCSYIAHLGIRMTVFGTTLDSKSVRILTQASSTKPGSVLHTEPVRFTESTEPVAATVSLKRDGNVQSIGVTNNFATNSEADHALKGGGAVEFSQISPCVLAVSIGGWKSTSKFVFPYPIDGTACKMKIARKSSWIEIRAPTSNALQSGGYKLDPFPVVGQDTSSLAWGMNRVDPDLQPPITASAPAPRFLQALSNMVFSRGERIQLCTDHSPGSVAPVIQLKESIRQVFLAFAGLRSDAPPGTRIQMFVLRHEDDFKFHIVAKALRHDLDTGSIFLDGFFVPVTPEFMKRYITSRTDQACLAIIASKEDLELWHRLMPALAERCRLWDHTAECNYKTKANLAFLCDCGVGQDAASMPGPYKALAKFATRIAIPLISAVPYVESMDDEAMVREMNAAVDAVELDKKKATSGGESCDNCGSDKPGLKVCSRCEKVKYCNHTCQKSAWKNHKKVCKRR
ncbi:hypothetical protein E4T44_02685 [Aureobasidium sp. EXF-8845]|nr:hypothetical protein E4T44_02685 [Aureobasidium sp. EXF-8845]KAI4855965.1 hypothetical protein E4T45_02581 [Aureobasidium sp. EXF-8846]